MSLTKDGQTISCDGPGNDGTGCPHTMRLPIGLRQLLNPNELPPTNGWLCVLGRGVARHFCPECAPDFLNTISPAQAASQAEWIGEEI